MGVWRFKLDPLPLLDSHVAAGSLALRPNHLLVWEPSRVAEIFRTETHLDGSDTLEPLVGKHSLLFANGPEHTAYRQVIGPQLRGRAWEPVIAAETEAALVDGVVDLPEWTRTLTLRIISRILFGEARDEFLSRFATWVDSALGSRRRALVYRYLRFPGVPAWRNFLRERDELRRLLLEFPAGLELGELTDEDRADQLVSLLFAGHETTASALTSALYWLDRSPGVLADLRGEPDGPLLEAVCREVLRISPPAVVAGNRVQGDTRLTPCIYAAHRNPEVFAKPLEFCPERFVGQRYPSSQYLPFGGGKRRCLGADLAMLELRTVLARLVQLDFRLVAPDRAVFGPRGQVLCFPELQAEFTRPARRG